MPSSRGMTPTERCKSFGWPVSPPRNNWGRFGAGLWLANLEEAS
jgi:hypothetical protein